MGKVDWRLMPVRSIKDLADSTLAAKLADRTELTESEAYDLPREELIERVLESMTIDELKELPEVAKNENVRKNLRHDVLAAARGEMVEKEREKAARDRADEENRYAPSIEEVELINSPPTVEIIQGSRPGRVEAVRVQRWVLGDDSRPVLEDIVIDKENPE
jgi:hypothetical protein